MKSIKEELNSLYSHTAKSWSNGKFWAVASSMAALTVAAFLLLSAAGVRPFNKNLAASVGDAEITLAQVERAASVLYANEAGQIDSADRAKALNLLVEVELLEQLSRENNVSIDETRYEEIVNNHSPDEGRLSDENYLELRRDFVRDRLKSALTGGAEGAWFVFNFFAYDKDVTLVSERKYLPSNAAQKHQEQKQYAKKLADEVHQGLKDGSLTTDTALEKVLNDPKIGAAKIGDPYFTWPKSDEFNLDDFAANAKVYKHAESKAKVESLKSGELSDVFTISMDKVLDDGTIKGDERVESAYAIVFVAEKQAKISEDFDAWFKQKKNERVKTFGITLPNDDDKNSLGFSSIIGPAYANDLTACDDASADIPAGATPANVQSNWATSSALAAIAVRLEYAPGTTTAGNGMNQDYSLTAWESATGTAKPDELGIVMLEHDIGGFAQEYARDSNDYVLEATHERFTCNQQTGKNRGNYIGFPGSSYSRINGWGVWGGGRGNQQGNMLSLDCTDGGAGSGDNNYFQVIPQTTPSTQDGYWRFAGSYSGDGISIFYEDGDSTNKTPGNVRFTISNGATGFIKFIWHQRNTVQVRQSGVSGSISGFSASPTETGGCDTSFSVSSTSPNCTDISAPIDTILTAPATSGTYYFTDWDGCDAFPDGATGRRCDVFVSGGNAQTVTAKYVNTSRVNVNSSSITGVSITSSGGCYTPTIPAVGSCGTTNWAMRSSGTISTNLTAPNTVNSGGVDYVFSSWTGCDSASANVCTATVGVGSTQTVTANYIVAPEANLSVTADPTSLHPLSGFAYTSCPNATPNPCGTANWTMNSISTISSTITVPAADPANYTFTGWTGDCANGNGPAIRDCQASVSPGNNEVITATYAQDAIINVGVSGVASTTITPSAEAGTCGSVPFAAPAICSSSATISTALTADLTSLGKNFTGWSGDCTGSAPCVLNINPGSVANVTANYASTNKLIVQVWNQTDSETLAMTMENVAPSNCGDTPDARYGDDSCPRTTNYTIEDADNIPGSGYVTFTARHFVPLNGEVYQFVGWCAIGGCSGDLGGTNNAARTQEARAANESTTQIIAVYKRISSTFRESEV